MGDKWQTTDGRRVRVGDKWETITALIYRHEPNVTQQESMDTTAANIYAHSAARIYGHNTTPI